MTLDERVPARHGPPRRRRRGARGAAARAADGRARARAGRRDGADRRRDRRRCAASRRRAYCAAGGRGPDRDRADEVLVAGGRRGQRADVAGERSAVRSALASVPSELAARQPVAVESNALVATPPPTNAVPLHRCGTRACCAGGHGAGVAQHQPVARARAVALPRHDADPRGRPGLGGELERRRRDGRTDPRPAVVDRHGRVAAGLGVDDDQRPARRSTSCPCPCAVLLTATSATDQVPGPPAATCVGDVRERLVVVPARVVGRLRDRRARRRRRTRRSGRAASRCSAVRSRCRSRRVRRTSTGPRTRSVRPAGTVSSGRRRHRDARRASRRVPAWRSSSGSMSSPLLSAVPLHQRVRAGRRAWRRRTAAAHRPRSRSSRRRTARAGTARRTTCSPCWCDADRRRTRGAGLDDAPCPARCPRPLTLTSPCDGGARRDVAEVADDPCGPWTRRSRWSATPPPSGVVAQVRRQAEGRDDASRRRRPDATDTVNRTVPAPLVEQHVRVARVEREDGRRRRERDRRAAAAASASSAAAETASVPSGPTKPGSRRERRPAASAEPPGSIGPAVHVHVVPTGFPHVHAPSATPTEHARRGGERHAGRAPTAGRRCWSRVSAAGVVCPSADGRGRAAGDAERRGPDQRERRDALVGRLPSAGHQQQRQLARADGLGAPAVRASVSGAAPAGERVDPAGQRVPRPRPPGRPVSARRLGGAASTGSAPGARAAGHPARQDHGDRTGPGVSGLPPTLATSSASVRVRPLTSCSGGRGRAQCQPGRRGGDDEPDRRRAVADPGAGHARARPSRRPGRRCRRPPPAA